MSGKKYTGKKNKTKNYSQFNGERWLTKLPLTSERSLERAVAQNRTRIIPNPLPHIIILALVRLSID